MSRFFLSAGSNIDPHLHVPRSIEALKSEFKLPRISSVYQTDPVGAAGEKKFWNYAAEIEFAGTREELAEKIRTLEARLGRQRDPQNKFAPRCIDLDILPQRDYEKQPFIIIPLAEIAPDEIEPFTQKKFRELVENFPEEKKTYIKTRYLA